MSENTNEILLQSDQSFEAPDHIRARARISPATYERMYADSVNDPDAFWLKVAREELEWFTAPETGRDWNYPDYTWFKGAKLNITHNCLDRHANGDKRDQTAFIYTNEAGDEQRITYGELLEQVCRCANGLRSLGIEKGDRVAIYMPLGIPQVVVMLACARIGAVHSVVYAGFSAHALRMRIEDAQAKMVVTSVWTLRRGKKIPLKEVVDEAVHGLDFVEHVLVDRRGDDIPLVGREKDLAELIAGQHHVCPPEVMDAEDPLFILYTSGTTGRPKGVLHTTGGYNLYTHYTTKISFDIQDDDVFWCTADTGWITGHSYIVYGPLSVGVTGIMVEGAPDYPDPGFWWSLVQRFGVTIFYTAPTAVRLFMKYGPEWPAKYDLSSLRILGSVGEPINPEAWLWYREHIGGRNAAVIDTWWQTETGGHMILSLPSCAQKPGKAGRPFFGVKADVVDRKGNPVPPNQVGFLVIREPWPSALRSCYGEPERFRKYWEEMEGFYYAGDFATKDEDGYIMILGRADDVLNVSGHRIGTAEVESALVSHPDVAEAAVIGLPHALKGESIKAFCILNQGVESSEDLVQSVKMKVREELGGLAVPDAVDFVPKLPKTRSGKIMRRVLKAQETGAELGDVSTLED